LLSRCPLNFSLRVGGFAPRHLSRYAPACVNAMKSKFVSRKELAALDFYDSVFKNIEIFFSDGNSRGCKIQIDFYDWEGNQAKRETDSSSEWTWKALTITFGYLAHFEYSMPDLMNRAQDIYELQFDYELERLRAIEEKQRQEFPQRQSPLFNTESEALSLKFVSENEDEENQGYILVIGSDVTLEWGGFDSYVGQTHFPIDDDLR